MKRQNENLKPVESETIERGNERTNVTHRSDCATHNEPAYPNGPCDCGVDDEHPASCGGTFEGIGTVDGKWRGRCINHDNRIVERGVDGRYRYVTERGNTPDIERRLKEAYAHDERMTETATWNMEQHRIQRDRADRAAARITELEGALRTTRPLMDAVIAIWRHTEQHTTYVPGKGYRWQTGEPPCSDPVEHERLAIAEGEAWHAFREHSIKGGTGAEKAGAGT